LSTTILITQNSYLRSIDVILASDIGITRALAILHSGGVIAHATETCYGFACDLSNPKAVQKLFDIKKRSYDQPVSALFPSMEEAQQYVEFSPKALDLAEKYLPGPLTLVLQRNKHAPSLIHICPPFLTAHRSQLIAPIGIRISSHPHNQQQQLPQQQQLQTHQKLYH
jgi:tRNA threonylcarbamoyl adenosine modification protein (Sua5/YciO/YrdC/YwlC family)